MKIIEQVGNDIATVYVGETSKGNLLEFVESTQPPIPREKKWVLLVSVLQGCVVGCPMCDAGGWYKGGLSREEIFEQIDHVVGKRFPDKKIPIEKFKIQFARMGDPALNSEVLDVLRDFPKIYSAPGLLPSVSTVAPYSCEGFLEKLLEIKTKYYSNNNFQLQFSIHTTDLELRDKLIPVKKWGFEEIAEYGKRFKTSNDKKITLNFALAQNCPLDANILRKHFDPEIFLIKITPVNPTINAKKNNIKSYLVESETEDKLNIIGKLRTAGFKVLVSIGELEENKIGSNCGQYLKQNRGES